jgi:hypothetical protein
MHHEPEALERDDAEHGDVVSPAQDHRAPRLDALRGAGVDEELAGYHGSPFDRTSSVA